MYSTMGLQAFPEADGISLRDDIDALAGTSVSGICLFREGSFCMAYGTDRELTVYNATEGKITGIRASSGEDTAELQTLLEPGEEKRFLLLFDADTVRVFYGEKERSVFTVRK